MVAGMMKCLLLPLLVLALVGCGDQVALEKTGSSGFTIDHLTIQIYDNGKPDSTRLLYLAIYKIGSFDFHLKKKDLEGDDAKIRSPAFQTTFDDLAAVTEHWLHDGHSYEGTTTYEPDVLPLVSISAARLNGTTRSISLQVSQATADKLHAEVEAALKPYLK